MQQPSRMFQVRLHGRGGQGVVTAAELLSVAAFVEGKYAQAFPSFGSERMGAPVMSYCRIQDRPIRSREPITEPDALIIQDPTLLHQAGIFDGLAPTGYLLVNSSRDPISLGLGDIQRRLPEGHCCTVAASEIAMRHIGRPLPNAVLLGALAALTGAFSIRSLVAAIEARFPGNIGEKNVAAASAAFETVRENLSAGVEVCSC